MQMQNAKGFKGFLVLALSLVLLLTMLLPLLASATDTDTTGSSSPGSSSPGSSSPDNGSGSGSNSDNGYYDSNFSDNEMSSGYEIKCMGYNLLSNVSRIGKGSKVDIRIVLVDTEIRGGIGSLLSKQYATLGSGAFVQTPEDSARSTISIGSDKKSVVVELYGLKYSGSGNTLAVDIAYQVGFGNIHKATISIPIIECSESGGSEVSALQPNILIENFWIETEQKQEPAAPSGDETVPSGDENQPEGEPAGDGGQQPADGSAPADGSGESMPPVQPRTGPVDDSSVLAGQKFILHFTLKNTSQNVAVRNMMVKVDGGEKFQLAGGTDTIYIESLGAQSTSEQAFELTSLANTPPAAYPVTLKVAFEYYDNSTKASGTQDLTLSLDVRQTARIRFNNVQVSSGFTYDELSMTYSIVNSGFTTLYNAEVRVYNGEEMIASKYVGTVEPSKEAKGSDIYLTFVEPGEKQLRVVFYYEDEMLNASEVDYDYTMNVDEYIEPTWEDPGLDPNMPVEPEGGFPMWIVWVGIAVVVVGGGVVLTLLLVKKKKAKQKAELEDYDEDL